MRRLITLAAALAGLLLAAPAANADHYAYATSTVNMRSGPGLIYPVIAVLGRGTRVLVHQCLPYPAWCDVETRRARGWVSARYLRDVGYYAPEYWGPSVIVPPIIYFDFEIYRDHERRKYYRPNPRKHFDRPAVRPKKGDGKRRPADAKLRDGKETAERERRIRR